MKPLPPHVLAVDPGREKVGLARVGMDGAILWRSIAPRSQLERVLAELAVHAPDTVVIGDGTDSKEGRRIVERAFGAEKVKQVDERHSTFEARALYFADNPPTGIWRLVPLSMQKPAVALDDYAAVVLARRYLNAAR